MGQGGSPGHYCAVSQVEGEAGVFGPKALCWDSIWKQYCVRVGWGQLPPGNSWPGSETPPLGLLFTFLAFLTYLYPAPSQKKKTIVRCKVPWEGGDKAVDMKSDLRAPAHLSQNIGEKVNTALISKKLCPSI